MERFLCPYCHPRPLTVQRQPDGAWVCSRCGDPLRRLPERGPAAAARVAPVAVVAGLLLSLGVGLTLLPNRWRLREPLSVPISQLAGEPQPTGDAAEAPQPLQPIWDALALAPQPGGLANVDREVLLQELRAADAAWIPRAERFPDGSTRYHYQRRAGEPPLSLDQIRDQIANPPSFEAEQAAIRELIDVLILAGVRIELAPPRKSGAAAEWDPQVRTLRVKPRVVASGSTEFAQVLNHEAIHVAQSCSNGGVRAMPGLLGLSRELPPHLDAVLGDAVYLSASPQMKELEKEAYANQRWLDLGPRLVRQHCRLAAPPSDGTGRLAGSS